MEANSKAIQADHLLKQAKHDMIELDIKQQKTIATIP